MTFKQLENPETGELYWLCADCRRIEIDHQLLDERESDFLPADITCTLCGRGVPETGGVEIGGGYDDETTADFIDPHHLAGHDYFGN